MFSHLFERLLLLLYFLRLSLRQLNCFLQIVFFLSSLSLTSVFVFLLRLTKTRNIASLLSPHIVCLWGKPTSELFEEAHHLRLYLISSRLVRPFHFSKTILIVTERKIMKSIKRLIKTNRFWRCLRLKAFWCRSSGLNQKLQGLKQNMIIVVDYLSILS